MDDCIDPPTFAELQASAGADFVVELVDTFAEEGPQLLEELRAAQAAGDVERFRRAAHALKSNGQTFGALQFAEQARSLELGGLARLGADGAQVQALAAEFARTLAALRTLAVAHRR